MTTDSLNALTDLLRLAEYAAARATFPSEAEAMRTAIARARTALAEEGTAERGEEPRGKGGRTLVIGPRVPIPGKEEVISDQWTVSSGEKFSISSVQCSGAEEVSSGGKFSVSGVQGSESGGADAGPRGEKEEPCEVTADGGAGAEAAVPEATSPGVASAGAASPENAAGGSEAEWDRPGTGGVPVGRRRGFPNGSAGCGGRFVRSLRPAPREGQA